MGEAETSTLREDIKILRMIVEESVDARADDPLFHAAAEILKERKERLEALK
jgi:hypothetical protein